MSFGIEYHKDQGIDAPFENLGPYIFMTSAFIFIMQKDLSDWIDTSNIQINEQVAKEISKSIVEK